jgi:RNA polymerase sigma-70 factor (ECF subfamily)
MTDEALQSLAIEGLAGDAGAYRAFLKGCAGLVRGYLRRRLSEAADVEDLVQEILLSIHTRRESYDPSLPVTAWVHAIAKYRLIDHWRRTGRRGVTIDIDHANELASEPEHAAADARRDVGVLLARLPVKQREAIRLVKLEEASVRDAAAALGLSESDVKVSIHRGLKALQRLMGAPHPS